MYVISSTLIWKHHQFNFVWTVTTMNVYLTLLIKVYSYFIKQPSVIPPPEVPNWIDKVREVAQSCPTLCDPTRLHRPWDFPGKNTGVGCHFLLQKIFPNQGSNLGLLHCRQTLYLLSHEGIDKVNSIHADAGNSWHKCCSLCRQGRSGALWITQASELMLPSSIMPISWNWPHPDIALAGDKGQLPPAVGQILTEDYFDIIQFWQTQQTVENY